MVASGCSSVLVNQTAEHVEAFDAIIDRERGHHRRGSGCRDIEADTAMWTAAVVVLEVTGEDPPQMLTIPDQRPVQTLGSDRAHSPLDIRVRPRRPRRDLDRCDASRGEYRIERGGELGVPIADQKPKLAGTFAEIHQ